jgi:hypothetical protein
MAHAFILTARRWGSIDGRDNLAASTHLQTRDPVSDAPGRRQSTTRNATLKTPSLPNPASRPRNTVAPAAFRMNRFQKGRLSA